MARRAAAPKVTPPTPGQAAAQAVKKIPALVWWAFKLAFQIGILLGTVFSVFGILFSTAAGGQGPSTMTCIGYGFLIGMLFGLGAFVVVVLRGMAFEDAQEGGRAYIATIFIVALAGFLLRFLGPLFVDHNLLRLVFLAGLAIAALMAIANIFLKDDYLRVVTWGAMLAAAALIVLFAVKATDGKGFDIHIKWPWSSSSEVDHTPKDVWLSRQNPVLYFDNVSWETSDTYHVSSASKRLDWEFAESSACGNVLVNGRYLLRNLCPGRPGERIMLEKSVLFREENTTEFQFIGKGMKGKVIATW